MRLLTLHNKYKYRGGEDESSESEDKILKHNGHTIFRYELDNSIIGNDNLIQVAANTVYSPSSYRRVRELLRTLRPDVVDVHNFFPLISPAAFYACQAEGVPVVQTLHNYRTVCPGTFFYRDGRVCEDCLDKLVPWAGIRHRCYRGSLRGSLTLAAMVTTHKLLHTWRDQITLYVVLSEFCRGKFIEAGFPAQKLRVKPNFVYPDPGEGEGTGEFALFAGRLVPEKGIATLLEAWRSPAIQTPLKIVGEGPLGDTVARECQLNPKVEWLGRRPTTELYSLMGQAKLVVVPSEWNETFGRVVVEAFATGTPVLVSDIGSLSELVSPGLTGYHFKPGDASDLARGVGMMLSDPDRLRSMRRQARVEYEKKYTAEINYKISLDIFEEARTTVVPRGVSVAVSSDDRQSALRVY